MKNYKEVEFDKIKYNNEYSKTHYDRIVVIVPTGVKSEIQKRSKGVGMTLTQYMLAALDYYENRKEN